MNAYITLDGKKYSAAHGNWTPQTERPVVVKRLLSGNTNVTFGPAPLVRWRGVLNADVTPKSGYGSPADLQATYNKMAALTFIDHYGTSCSVIIDRNVDESSFTPVWDGSANKIQVNLTVIKL